jgi:hypothetical protein
VQEAHLLAVVAATAEPVVLETDLSLALSLVVHLTYTQVEVEVVVVLVVIVVLAEMETGEITLVAEQAA